MIDTVVDLLQCPVCTSPLAVNDQAVRCERGHSFDLGRPGYVNLLTRQRKGVNADSAEMISARDRFLATGAYRLLADRLAAAAAASVPSGAAVLEAGAGTGYYLARVIDALDDARGIATDLSVPAVRRAARAGPRLGAVVADTWAGLPVTTAALDLIMVVFAPRNPAEFARIVRPGGRLLIATAADDHLRQLRDRLGMIDIRPGKLTSLIDSLQDWFELELTDGLRSELALDSAAVRDLVLMGPNAHHQHGDLDQRIAMLADPTTVTASVELSIFRRR